MHILFELGRNHELSRAEIEHVFLAQNISATFQQQDAWLFVETHSPIDFSVLMKQLAGTKKIAERMSEQTDTEAITTLLETLSPEGKIVFSLSGQNAKRLALEAKKALKASGRSVRYIESNNTATILHNNLLEKQGDLTITNAGIFVTRAIQPIEDWSDRDFGRPGRDSKSGMLPPKLARILINLSGISTSGSLLDPFCGSGTVLTEAMLLGVSQIFGSDLSEKAVSDTQQNISWIEQTHASSSRTKVFTSDVSRVHTHLPQDSIDAIVTEPYLGRPLRGNEDLSSIKKQAEDLKALYLGAFKSFTHVLKKNATVVFIIPRFRYQDTWVRIDCLEKIQNMGFSLERLTPKEPSILYHREDQFVGREVWKFNKI